MSAPTYAVEWDYRPNNGNKADRFGPCMLQAQLVRSCVDPQGQKQIDKVQLGVVSLECINEVSHRHAFWVITEAALNALELDTATDELISGELSRVVPLPSEGEIRDYRNTLDALSRALRKR
jgi:hypothetical protein